MRRKNIRYAATLRQRQTWHQAACASSGITRTAPAFATPLEHGCIDHGRTDIFASQALLHRPNIIAIFYEMRGKTLSQGMTTPALVEPRLVSRALDGLLAHRLCQRVPTCHTRTRIAGASRRRKDLWPCPCCRRAWLVPFACLWDMPRTTACEPLGLLPQCSSLQRSLQPRLSRLRKPGDTIVRAVPIMPRALVGGNIAILHPEASTFQQAHTSAIPQPGHQMRHAVAVGQQARHCLAGAHHRHVSRSLGALDRPQCWDILLAHSAREQDAGRQCPMLRRSCDTVMHGQVGQQGASLWRSHGCGVALGMPAEHASPPADIGRFRAETPVLQAQHQAPGSESLSFGLPQSAARTMPVSEATPSVRSCP